MVEEMHAPATKRLFYDDPYLKECRARVRKVDGNKVWLDQTLFFAFSGGQESDSGKVNGISLQSVEWDAQGDLVHIFSQPVPFKVGEEAHLELDWEKRWKLMRLHSAAHVVIELFERAHGKQECIGSNISSSKARYDIVWPENIKPLLSNLEAESNAFIASSKPIQAFFDEKEKGLRWWVCEDMKMNCSGTHVRNTSEIGRIALKRSNIGKGKERIEIVLMEGI